MAGIIPYVVFWRWENLLPSKSASNLNAAKLGVWTVACYLQFGGAMLSQDNRLLFPRSSFSSPLSNLELQREEPLMHKPLKTWKMHTSHGRRFHIVQEITTGGKSGVPVFPRGWILSGSPESTTWQVRNQDLEDARINKLFLCPVFSAFYILADPCWQATTQVRVTQNNSRNLKLSRPGYSFTQETAGLQSLTCSSYLIVSEFGRFPVGCY